MQSVGGPGEGYGLKPPWVIADPGEASYTEKSVNDTEMETGAFFVMAPHRK